jgi:hypothetical protein
LNRLIHLLSALSLPLSLFLALYLIAWNLFAFQSAYLAVPTSAIELYGTVSRMESVAGIGRLSLELNADRQQLLDLYLDQTSAAHIEANFQPRDYLRVVAYPSIANLGHHWVAVQVESGEWSLDSEALATRVNRIRIFGAAVNLTLLFAAGLLVRAMVARRKIRHTTLGAPAERTDERSSENRP